MSNSNDSYHERIQHYSAQRVEPFNSANRRYPQARETERSLLIDLLDIAEPGPEGLIVDTNAGGGFLSEGIRAMFGPDVRIVCLDPASNFTADLEKTLERVVAPLHDMPFAEGSVDWVTNLVGMHHLSNKQAFLDESFRILKPGGGLACADAQIESPAARWLNGPVDRFTDIGHDGMFLDAGELTLSLEKAGFTDVSEYFHTYTWDFPDRIFMAQYCSDLFRLSKASLEEVLAALENTLEIRDVNGGVSMGWGLIYARARKPG